MEDNAGHKPEAPEQRGEIKSGAEEAGIVFRPALRSSWFLFFGLFLGPAIIYFERDPHGHPAKWIALSLLFLAFILHRVSLKYTINNDFLKVSSWWGLRPEEKLTLAHISGTTILQGFAARLVGCGNIEVTSAAYDEAAAVVLGQPDAWKTAGLIEKAAARAKGRADGQE